ncbi:outer membrane protein assembly factor BamD [Sulfurivirga sp.]|uniref:outer membrane protein assembly factor BamD n=1 Tax=Sulfurivirga sp. TaxID=2614236 RepID=UPI0025EAE921|nr:outer membrane protein assembly factor BamD [Sulfurivirga sp.]
MTVKHGQAWLLAGALLAVSAGTQAAAKVEVIGDTTALEKRVGRLERMLENPVLLQLSDRLAEQQKEIQQLQDRLDRLQYRLKQQDRQHRQRIEGLETRIAQLEAQLKAQARPSETETPASEEKPADGGKSGALRADELGGKGSASGRQKARAEAGKLHRPTAEELKLYDEGMTLLKKSAYRQAAAKLDAFHKKHPRSELAPNAAYWAGEAYMVQLAFDKAWPRFKRVIDHYPHSNKYGDSLLRGSDALAKLGRKKEAIALLERLLADKTLPESLKTRAKKRLAKLKGGQ